RNETAIQRYAENWLNDEQWRKVEWKTNISKEWIDRATQAYCNINSPTHQYGYFWWGQDVEIGDKTYHVSSVRGAGGQFIFMIPELDLVVVFTSYYAKQTGIKLLETLILPSFVKNIK
ncbi:MAG: hypothetical protein U9O87_01860, partial [Verrucomicrobiota bacterium]|nr:hypothetical protein [Verrucomicrobiota bacterium]